MISLGSLFGSVANGSAWSIVSLVLGIVGAILGYFMFVRTEKKYPNKFVNWLRDFLDFKEMLIETILKITYMFLAIFITLASFDLIRFDFLMFVLTLVLGNLILRVTYESIMVLLGIWKNTKEINAKIKK